MNEERKTEYVARMSRVKKVHGLWKVWECDTYENGYKEDRYAFVADGSAYYDANEAIEASLIYVFWSCVDYDRRFVVETPDGELFEANVVPTINYEVEGIWPYGTSGEED